MDLTDPQVVRERIISAFVYDHVWTLLRTKVVTVGWRMGIDPDVRMTERIATELFDHVVPAFNTISSSSDLCHDSGLPIEEVIANRIYWNVHCYLDLD